MQPELVKLDGKAIRYIAPLPKGVTTQSLMSGFGDKASDYDFTITNTATGFGQRIRADQPMAKINMWSITADLQPGTLYRHRDQARRDQALDLYLRLLWTQTVTGGRR